MYIRWCYLELRSPIDNLAFNLNKGGQISFLSGFFVLKILFTVITILHTNRNLQPKSSIIQRDLVTWSLLLLKLLKIVASTVVVFFTSLNSINLHYNTRSDNVRDFRVKVFPRAAAIPFIRGNHHRRMARRPS
jgi:hypothetical protein